MIKLRKINNLDDIKTLLTKDALYKEILGKDTIEDIDISPETISFMTVSDKGELVGIIAMHIMPNKQVAFHCGLYKEFRGKESTRYCNQSLKILKRIVYPLHIIALIPEHNKQCVAAINKTKFKYKKTLTLQDEKFLLYIE